MRIPLVELPNFQGPLDLLLQLIQADKVDIYDIPIAHIADQFVLAVQQMEYLDMEVTSEFLVLAAHLLYIKSRYLLPKPPRAEESFDDKEDPRQELVERLLSYRAYKQAAQVLGALETSSGQRFFREVDIESLLVNIQVEDPLNGVSFAELWQAFRGVVIRAEKGEEIRHIEPDEIAIEVVLRDIWRRVLLHPQGVGLRQLLRTSSRMEVVVAFLALLELLRAGRLRVEQASPQSDIYLFPAAKAWEFTEEE
ncbi:MAG: segregation and condensation protein A [Desulfitobacteriaceae bacterium]